MLFYFFEFKNRLIYIFTTWLFFFLICLFYKESLLYFLVKISLFQNSSNYTYFIYTHLTEVFIAYIKISFIISLYLTFPIVVIHIFNFIRPGLYHFEYKLLKKFVFICSFIWLVNNICIYYIFIPYIWNYFCSFDNNLLQGPLGLHFEAKLNEYIHFLISVYFFTNFSSQLFFWLYLLILNYNPYDLIFINKSRRYSYLLIFIFASIVTPPDVISQLAIAIPLLFFYEFIIITFLFDNEYARI